MSCAHLAFFAFLMLPSLARAGSTNDLEVVATLSTNRVALGTVVDLSVEVRHPGGGAVTLPEIDHPKEIVVRSRDRRTAATKDGRAKTNFDFRLASYRLGEHLISTGIVRFTALDGAVYEKPFPSLRLNVQAVRQQGDGNLRDLPDAATLPHPWRKRLPWILGVAALTAIAALLLARLLRHYRPKPPPPKPPELPTAHLLALKALRELRERNLPAEGRHEEFVVGVSLILRTYLEKRFKLEAPERTTEEFIAEASRSRELNLERQSMVREFLEQCDLVKFARFTPDASQDEHLLTTAERFVRETTPAGIKKE
jgi:hypothetical protein